MLRCNRPRVRFDGGNSTFVGCSPPSFEVLEAFGVMPTTRLFASAPASSLPSTDLSVIVNNVHGRAP